MTEEFWFSVPPLKPGMPEEQRAFLDMFGSLVGDLLSSQPGSGAIARSVLEGRTWLEVCLRPEKLIGVRLVGEFDKLEIGEIPAWGLDIPDDLEGWD